MRIHRIALHNFRATTEREVAFALAGITVIEGANEAGKTSIADALTMLLDEPDSSKKAPVLAAQPKGRDVGAEVEAEISTGPYHFVYAKRWHRKPMTTLTIDAPAREQLTGRDAHDRVRQILDETLDAGLWAALRMDQRALPAQAALGGNPSLIAALDAASGGSLGSETEASLYARVESEYARHWTSTGRPTGDYRDATEALAQAQRRFEDADRDLTAVQEDVDRHEHLSRELARLRAQLPAAEQRAAVAADRWKAVEDLRRRVENLERQAELAEKAQQLAAAAVDERNRLLDDLARAESWIAELGTAAKVLESQRVAAAARLEQARGAREQARTAVAAADQAERLATEDAEFRRRQLDITLMSERLDQAVAAERELAAVDEVLAGPPIDDELLQRIEDSNLRAVRARAISEAAAATLSIQAAADIEFTVDGGAVSLPAGERLEQRLTKPTTVELPGLAAISYQPGAGAADHVTAQTRADDELAALLAGINAPDVETARELHANRRGAVLRRTSAERAKTSALNDLSIDELARRIDGLRRKVDAYAKQREPGPPLPPDYDAAARLRDEARTGASGARERLARCDDGLELASAATKELDDSVTRTDEQLRAATAARIRAQGFLDDARAHASEEQLTEALRVANKALSEAVRFHSIEANALATSDATAFEAENESALEALHRLREDLDRCGRETFGLEMRIESAGGRGLFDRHAEAKSTLAATERAHRGCEQRALASQRLFKVLHQHREQAKRDYVAPYRDRIESLGRIVFGSSFAVELDEDLRIVNRTLDGLTVPYAELSSGAREQLCIIGRLACAALVAGEGVPVVIDDALGHSDPDRLERLGAVFTASCRDAQVIVLTCMPDRYRSVAAAQVVTLTPERAPVVPLPATSDEREEAADTLAG